MQKKEVVRKSKIILEKVNNRLLLLQRFTEIDQTAQQSVASDEGMRGWR